MTCAIGKTLWRRGRLRTGRIFWQMQCSIVGNFYKPTFINDAAITPAETERENNDYDRANPKPYRRGPPGMCEIEPRRVPPMVRGRSILVSVAPESRTDRYHRRPMVRRIGVWRSGGS